MDRSSKVLTCFLKDPGVYRLSERFRPALPLWTSISLSAVAFIDIWVHEYGILSRVTGPQPLELAVRHSLLELSSNGPQMSLGSGHHTLLY